MKSSRQLTAELLGTAFLLMGVVGSGIMAQRLAESNQALALLANTVATGAILYTLIVTLAPISGAHFNPAVTLSFLWQKQMKTWQAGTYILMQLAGAFIGVAIAHLMFAEAIFSASTNTRSGASQWLSEFVATFGLLTVIIGSARMQPKATALTVAAYITAAYWFTASTSFANPAVTLARAATDTFSGIRPIDAPGFVISQIIAAAAATWVADWLFRPKDTSGYQKGI